MGIFCQKTARLSLIVLLSTCAVCKRENPAGPQFSSGPSSTAKPTYRLVVHPLYNPARLIQVYQPAIDYLNRRLTNGQLVLEASRDYHKFEEKYRARKGDFLLPNPWQALQAMTVGYHVIAMAGEPADFKGIFVARRDSPVKVPADLKGKAVSYPAPTALAACLMPQLYLHDRGIDVNVDITNNYVGSQESSILNAYTGHTAVAATWPPPWRAFQKDHPQEASQLKVLWETESLVNNAIMARDDLPTTLVDEVRTLLLGLDGSQEGKAVLSGMETARILPASDASYEVVRRYVARFEREVRPVEDQR
jgi:phosphonate transport system substrate-binding protein